MTMLEEQRAPDAARTGEEGADAAARLIVRTPDGESRVLTGRAGFTVMEVIREAGIDELPALCGGSCSCATCHVHVAAEWLARLPAMSDDEDAVLSDAVDRNERSRLSCQIPFSDTLDGLEVVIARME